MKELELLCCELISAAGMARSCNIEAIKVAKKGNFKKAEELIKEGKEHYLKAHDVHNKLLQVKAGLEEINSSILIMHSEDQLMSAEMFQILSQEFIDTYQRMIDLEKKQSSN